MSRRIESKSKDGKNTAIEGYIKSLSNQKRDFVIDEKRNVQALIYRGKFSLITKNKNNIDDKDSTINKNEIINLFAQVAKSVNRYILKNDFNVEQIENYHTANQTNKKRFSELKIGDVFYYIDVNHCFWRISYKMGYISKNLYNNVLKKPELKIYRNMALACIIAPRRRKYFVRGELLIEIAEDKTLYKRIYNNIRFLAYNLMGDMAEYVGNDFIAYKTDGIMVVKNSLETIKEILTENDLFYKVFECVKIDEKHYKMGNEEKIRKL